MSCSRGQAAPNEATTKQLFAASAGYCQKPDCRRELFVEMDERTFHIAEMAHIAAAGDAGPRADTTLSKEARGAFLNLLLLCPSCHTIVDKAPEVYTDALVRSWKRLHADKLGLLFGVQVFERRSEARRAVEPLLRENRYIFATYGPHNEYRLYPDSDLAQVWRRKVRTKILPNNRRVLALIDANEHLLAPHERDALEAFRQHVDDLEVRHLSLGPRVPGARFPDAMEAVFRDNE
jgi:hypothetical protein